MAAVAMPALSGDALAKRMDELAQQRDRLMTQIAEKEVELSSLDHMEARMLAPQSRQATTDVLADILGPFNENVLAALRKEYRGMRDHDVAGSASSVPPPAALMPVGPDGVHFRSLRQSEPLQINLLIAGAPNMGKRSVASALAAQHAPALLRSLADAPAGEYVVADLVVDHTVTRLRVCVAHVDSDECIESVASFVKRQHQHKFESDVAAVFSLSAHEEPDLRVHACIYLLPPFGNAASVAVHMQALSRLDRYCNVIPVIAHSDGLDEGELRERQQMYRDLFAEYDVHPYAAGIDAAKMPLAIAAGVDGGLERAFAHGTFAVDAGSDMPLLRSILFETHTAHLKGLTHAACYMRYRLAKRERLVEHERKRFASIARGLI